MTNNVTLALSDARGVYIPQHFVEGFSLEAWGLSPDSWAVQQCLAGPESEGYWDAWDELLRTAKHVDGNGIEWTLHQDGDLWFVALDWMTEEEKENFFGM